MELSKTVCLDCGHLNRWYAYKWADAEHKRNYNHKNSTECPSCGSKNVKNQEDAETMASYRSMVNVLFKGKT